MPSVPKLLLALGLMATLGACAAEQKTSGGLAGAVADHTLPGSTKELQLYRAAAIYAVLSSAGSRLAADPDQIFATLRYMTAVRNDLNGLAGHLWPPASSLTQPCGLKPANGPCLDRRVTFESDLPVLEGNMYKLAVVGLPVKALEKVFSSVVAQDWVGALTGLLKPAEEALGAAHYGAATYRAEREILATIVWLQKKDQAFDPGDTVQRAHAVLAKLEKDGAPDPDAYEPIGLWLRGNPAAFNPLYDMVQTACARMVGRLPDKKLNMAKEVVGAPDSVSKITDPDKKRVAICASFKFDPA